MALSLRFCCSHVPIYNRALQSSLTNHLTSVERAVCWLLACSSPPSWHFSPSKLVHWVMWSVKQLPHWLLLKLMNLHLSPTLLAQHTVILVQRPTGLAEVRSCWWWPASFSFNSTGRLSSKSWLYPSCFRGRRIGYPILWILLMDILIVYWDIVQGTLDIGHRRVLSSLRTKEPIPLKCQFSIYLD